MKTIAEACRDPNAVIIDVRTEIEHAEQCLKQAHILKPLDQLNPAAFETEHNLSKDQPLYFLCRAGSRATQAADKFKQAGFTNTHVITGGILACPACETHAPETSKPPRITLDGQIRMAIGLCLILISLAGFFVTSAAFFFIPIMATMLIISGITGWCGLGLLLAKAPWNQNL